MRDLIKEMLDVTELKMPTNYYGHYLRKKITVHYLACSVEES